VGRFGNLKTVSPRFGFGGSIHRRTNGPPLAWLRKEMDPPAWMVGVSDNVRGSTVLEW